MARLPTRPSAPTHPRADSTATDAPSTDTDVPSTPDAATSDVGPVDVSSPDACVPRCANRVCGDDGCGGSCAPRCASGESCVTSTGLCAVREASWTRRSPASAPVGRQYATMAFDRERGGVVLFGEDSASSTYACDTCGVLTSAPSTTHARPAPPPWRAPTR